MRLATIAFLFCLGLTSGFRLSSDRTTDTSKYPSQDGSEFLPLSSLKAIPFQPGFEHTFLYDTQIASGLVPADISGEPLIPEQKAVTRLQALVKIDFSSKRQAALKLTQINLGQLNDHFPRPDRVKPMRVFQPMQLPNERRIQLELPAQFIYDDGVIERIKFHESDDSWSKNIKRGVLNMIQLNLRRNNAQGTVKPEIMLDRQQKVEDDFSLATEEDQFSFIIPEITVEGECQVLYSVFNPQVSRLPTETVNVTKSINYKLCRRIPDVAFGHQMEQIQQLQNAQCQAQWQKQLQQQLLVSSGKVEDFNKMVELQNPCEGTDPKEIKEHRLDRSTVLRYELDQNTDQSDRKYSIKRVEALSHYVYKNTLAETSEYGSAMHTIVSSQLVFKNAEPGLNRVAQQPHISPEKDETLLASNSWMADEKRFQMYGDEEFMGGNNPFRRVQNKVDVAEQAFRKVVRALQRSATNGIEAESAIQLQKLVEILRISSVEELIQIESVVKQIPISSVFAPSDLIHGSEFLLADALALAGTRNTIYRLVEMVLTKEIPENKAAQALKSLINLPSPSDSQIKLVLRLCQSELANSHHLLKQSCWLAVGGMMNEVCQQTCKKPYKTVFGKQSGFVSNEKCPLDKKQKYKEILTNLFHSAQSTYERVLALKTIGNAGLDIMVHYLEELITNKSEERMIRMMAIDALRRQRSMMPRKIQAILLPIFLNNRENPEVRMAAFVMIMETIPGKQVISQIAFQMTRERSKHVLSFVYNTLKSISLSPNPLQKEMAVQIRNALKMVNVDEETLYMSGKKQIPIFSYEQGEGLFVSISSIISGHSKLPTALVARLDSMLNKDFQNNDFSIRIVQRDIEQIYEKLVDVYRWGSESNKSLLSSQSYPEMYPSDSARNIQKTFTTPTTTSTSPYRERLQQIFSRFGFKIRRGLTTPAVSGITGLQQSGAKWQNEEMAGGGEPIALISLRMSDNDLAIVPVSRQLGPKFLRRVMNGEGFPSLDLIVEFMLSLPFPFGESRHLKRSILAMNLNEKRAVIWTSAGIPITIAQSSPLIGFFEGNKASVSVDRNQNIQNLQTESSGIIGIEDRPLEGISASSFPSSSLLSDEQKTKVLVHIHPSVSVSQLRKMDVWLPVFVTGVKSVRSAQFNAQIDTELTIQNKNEIQLAINVPRKEKIRIFGLQTIPATFVAQYSSNSEMLLEPSYKGIHNPVLEPMQREVDLVVGESTGLRTRIHGHYFRPTEPTNYKQLIQMLMATENHIHVDFMPNELTPSQILVKISGGSFEKVKIQEPVFSRMFDRRPNMNTAYSTDRNVFESEYQRIKEFVKDYKPTTMYSHSVKVTALTVGGPRELKADLLAQAVCESNLRYCKFNLDVERTSLDSSVSPKYLWNTRMEMLRPRWVNTAEQLDNLDENDRKFTLSLETEWGHQGEKRLSFIDLKVLGEQAFLQQWRRMGGDLAAHTGSGLLPVDQIASQFPSKFYVDRSDNLLPRFLNKYSVYASSNLGTSPWDEDESEEREEERREEQRFMDSMKGTRSSMFLDKIAKKVAEMAQLYGIKVAETMVKTWLPIPRTAMIELFDKVARQLRKQDQQKHIQFQMVIDPTTHWYGNLSIRTPDEFDTYNLMPLRTKFPAPSLLSSRWDDEINVRSLDKMLQGIDSKIRDECRVDGNFVKTFDNVVYQAPISNCYSVLAKDCSSERPEFVVLMKKRADDMTRKKIRVITPQKLIECEGRQDDRVDCQVNNQVITEVDDDRNVEFVGPMKSQVLINMPGIVVQFNGKKATVQISSIYKNTQCGLCGHYDGESENEWRMADNQLTADLSNFHRSYSLLHDEGECTPQYHQSFYQTNAKNIRLAPLNYEGSMETSVGSGLPIRSTDIEDDEEWKMAIKNSHNLMLIDDDQISTSSSKRYWKDQMKPRKIQPQLQTRYKEYNEKICFSKEPVQTCPRGSYPVLRDQTNTINRRVLAGRQMKKVVFTCLSPSTDLTMNLLKQARWGTVLDLSGSPPSFQEEVPIETECEQHYN